MKRTALVLAAALTLAGCGGQAASTGSAETSASASSSAAKSTSSPSHASDASFALATKICTDGLTEPDGLVSDAARGAREGTRSVAEVTDAFRNAQNAVARLSDQSAADYPYLSQSLQTYADVLGRARVVGDRGLSEITDARAAVNTACYTPSAPTT